jgi:hypothetical protein
MRKALERLRALKPQTKADLEWVSYSVADSELAQALSLPNDVALTLLCGLIATGNVRALNKDRELIDLGDCTIAELEGKPAFVAADDLRDWLHEHSTLPSDRDRLIAQKLRAGINPPRTIPWKPFCNDIRDGCGGWIGNGTKRKPAHGFSDKQIQRAVKDLRSN